MYWLEAWAQWLGWLNQWQRLWWGYVLPPEPALLAPRDDTPAETKVRGFGQKEPLWMTEIRALLGS